MMLRWSGRIGVVGVLGVLLWVAPAWGHGETVQYTSFMTAEIRPPLIVGTLWLEFDAVNALYPVDRDGDGQCTKAEVFGIRRALAAYLNRSLLMMWQGRVGPLEIEHLERGRRPRLGHDYLKIKFTVRDLPPGVPMGIASTLLREFSPKARCMALITREGRREVFVLGPEDYYRSERLPAQKVAGGVYRPRSQRGRLAAAGQLRLEMLYAIPEGAFYLYILEEDRETPHGIEAKPIVASIAERGRDGDIAETRKAYALLPKPLGTEKQGDCARFVIEVSEWKGVQRFGVDLEFGSGAERRRVVFDFPAVEILPGEGVAGARPRYACPELCLGVESKDKSAKCMRCGAVLVEAGGATVPGLGRIGAHGGALSKLNRPGVLLEGLLTSGYELRLYMTDEGMKPRSVEGMGGRVLVWLNPRVEDVPVEIILAPTENGSYLSAMIPAEAVLPVSAQCAIDFGDGREPNTVTVQFYETIDPDN
jgi:hypothetical protein